MRLRLCLIEAAPALIEAAPVQAPSFKKFVSIGWAGKWCSSANPPSDMAEGVIGCSECEHLLAGTPSDLIECVDGCIKFEHFWVGTPSDMA